jgi:hypothetical protein
MTKCSAAARWRELVARVLGNEALLPATERLFELDFFLADAMRFSLAQSS